MKQIKLLFLMLIGVLVSISFSSCSSTDEPQPEPTPTDEGVVYEVKLNFAGEIADITESEEPISRTGETTPKRVYGINIWCMKTDGTESFYKNYAYGLFDNKEDMVISLLGGYMYRFECYMVEDDVEQLYVSDYKLTGEYPFGYSYIENKFIIGSSSSNYHFDSTKITTKKSYEKESSYNHLYNYQDKPVIGIFYGILSDYTPSEDATAIIPLYKIGYYGLKIIVSGVPDGSLEVSPSYRDRIYIKTGTNTSSYSSISWDKTFSEAGSVEQLFTGGFYSALTYSDWLSKMQNYSTSTSVSFTWTRANGYMQSFSKDVTLKRNVMTVLTVNLTGGAGEVSIGFEEHSDDMITENDSVDYDGGNLNDTPVNPEE